MSLDLDMSQAPFVSTRCRRDWVSISCGARKSEPRALNSLSEDQRNFLEVANVHAESDHESRSDLCVQTIMEYLVTFPYPSSDMVIRVKTCRRDWCGRSSPFRGRNHISTRLAGEC
ncbi:hypothetical protein TWF694_006512 [Orbilia ellipsospora]|uniref:Uncharacterized protein n=1 Tax=Orbilia ellipsospora TaxID=2528407 RepID=A0AAV9XMX0_9PEZI